MVFASTLADRPPSLLPFPIDGRGQPLFSLESTSSHTDQALVLFSHALGSASTGFFYTRFSLVTLDPWGASSFLFSPPLFPVFSILSAMSPVLASLPIPPPPLPSLPALLASLHSLLLHLRQVAQCSAPCPFLTDIACHYVPLCRSLIFLPPPSVLFPSATWEST